MVAGDEVGNRADDGASLPDAAEVAEQLLIRHGRAKSLCKIFPIGAIVAGFSDNCRPRWHCGKNLQRRPVVGKQCSQDVGIVMSSILCTSMERR
jgi:hypothetical protein